MSTKNSQLRESFYKNAKQVANVKQAAQDNQAKAPFNYSQQKKASSKDLSPSSGVNLSTQFFNNPYYQSTKNRANNRSNNISPLNRFISPKVNGPQECKIGQKRAQSSCRPSINNQINYDANQFSILDQFKMSPQMPLNLGRSQELQQIHLQQPQNNQSQKRKIRMLRQSIGSRQATRHDEPVIEDFEYTNNSSNINTNFNFMDQTPASRKSQQRKDSTNQNQQRIINNSQMYSRHNAPPQISPNNIGDAYFKNSVFQSNTPISVITPSSYGNHINQNNPSNPVIIKNSINNISVQIGNCNEMNHSFKLSNKHSKDVVNDNQLYDFNFENMDSSCLPTEQVCRIDTNISFDQNSNSQDDRQTRIYALQKYLKNTQTTKYSRNQRRSAAHSSHAANQVKQIDENNLMHSESKQSKNSNTVSNLNTNNITKISDENQIPEYQQTIKKQLNCIQVCDPSTANMMGATAAPRNKSPMPQNVFQKFDQNVQLLGNTDPCNLKFNKNDKNINGLTDPTLINIQGNNGYNKQNLKVDQQTVVPYINQQIPQIPQEINNQDVEELHFQFVEFQQKCKEWLKKIEI
ncbi:hypothetical protein ABPG72_004749 [Tetrahymena utriculariae]